jgi:GT2 family glycosyltransferase
VTDQGGELAASIVVPVESVTPATIDHLRSLAATAATGAAEVLVVGTREVCGALAAHAGRSAVALLESDAPDYATCANAGASVARGGVLIFLEGRPIVAGWLEHVVRAFEDPDVEVLGGQVSSTADASRGGWILVPAGANKPGFALLPTTVLPRDGSPDGMTDCDLLLRACFATTSRLFRQLGGFDAAFADGDEVFDLCLRARDLGVRIVEHAGFVVRDDVSAWPRPGDRDAKRRAFLERWSTRAVPRPNFWCERRGAILRADGSGSAGRILVPLPPATLVVHGAANGDSADFAAAVERSRLRPNRVVWAHDAPGSVARELSEPRGEGYVAFVRTDTRLAPDWLNSLVDALESSDDVVAATAGDGIDARCTLVAPHLVPQHVRIDPDLPLDEGVAQWLSAVIGQGRSLRRVAAAAEVGPSGAVAPAWAPTPESPPFASIIMLSWNAPDYTESAVASIVRCTRLPYEIIVIDNGSSEETRARLARLENVRIIYNERNLGFATGCNQGAAAARGTHVVWLNNDVIVTEGWLEALVALHRQRATIGITVPVSNNVYGHQRIVDAPTDTGQLAAFAAERAARLRGRWYRADLVMGLCMCIRREVIDEIGGMDPRYPIGNFEDVDYCVRTRAAGYEIAVCEDAFVHHFGSVSFRANGVDYNEHMTANFTRFVERWNVRPDPLLSVAVREPIRRGFSRASDFVPLPAVEAGPPLPNG